jgi:carboxypeptidase family protein
VNRLLSAALLLTGCFVSVFSFAQSTQPENGLAPRQSIKVSHIRGVVADENRAVIRRVKVALQKAKGDGWVDVEKLEANGVGRFDFSSVSAGKYRLIFQSPGFCPASIPVEVLSTGWDAFWLTMTVAAMDSNLPCDDKYKAENLDKPSFEAGKLAN